MGTLKKVAGLVDSLQVGFTPKEICIKHGYCKKKTHELQTYYTSKQLHKKSSIVICDMCKMVLRKLNDMKNVDNKWDDMKDNLDGICDELGTGLTDEVCKICITSRQNNRNLSLKSIENTCSHFFLMKMDN